MPASMITAVAGSIGMLAGALVDALPAHATVPAHAAHGAAHSGVYSWIFMVLACWLSGWIVMGRTQGRATCLLTSTVLMIGVPVALSSVGMGIDSVLGAHAMMISTMVFAHECGVRVAARVRTFSRASTATAERLPSPPST
jgi:hypothetical protein